MDGWDSIQINHRLLIILDGFDEMTIQLDQDSLQRTLSNLISCIEINFSKQKIIITTRKPFFQEHFQNDSWLYEKLDFPEIYQIAPIPYQDKIMFLEANVSEYDRPKLLKFKELHDPLGLASKVLFLQMVKDTISELPEENIDEVIIYEKYIDKTLKRKEFLLEKSGLQLPVSALVENLKEILEMAAFKLYINGKEFIFLSELGINEELECLAKILWDTCEVNEATEDDALARIAIRSLLSPVEIKKDIQGENKWPVEFCHRSMREYFFAKWVYKALLKQEDDISEVLSKIELNHEIILFVKLLIQKDDCHKMNIINYLEQLLLSSIRGASLDEAYKKSYLTIGRNSINIIYQVTKKLKGEDWSNIMIDNAYLPEIDLSNKKLIGASLRYANINNSNLSNADFTNADISGVNLKEIKKIRDFSFFNGRILGLYNDNSNWIWSKNNLGDYIVQKLDMESSVIDAGLKYFNDSFTLLYNNERIIFYNKKEDNFEKVSEFRNFSDHKIVKIYQNIIVLLNHKDKYLYLIELNPFNVIVGIEYVEDGLFDIFDNRVFVYYLKERKVIEVSDHTLSIKCIIEKVSDVKTLATYKFDNNFLLAVGYENGLIELWTIEFDGIKLEIIDSSSFKLEDSAINKIEFVDSGKLIYSSITGKLGFVNLVNGDKKYLQNKIKFKGMIIKGLKSEKENDYLKTRV